MLTSAEIHLLIGNKTKDDLQRSLYPDGLAFLKSLNDIEIQKLNFVKLKEIIAQKKVPAKIDMIQICFCWLYNEASLESYLKYKGKIFENIFIKLIYTDSISKHEMEQLLGARPFSAKKFYYHLEIEKHSLLESFECSVDKNRYYNIDKLNSDELYNLIDANFQLPISIRKISAKYLSKPKGYLMTPLDSTFFKNKDLKLFNAESLIHQEFLAISTYIFQDGVKYSEKGKPNFASLNKYQKLLNIEEYYPNNSEIYNIRTNQVLSVMQKLKKEHIVLPLHNLLKELISNRYNKESHISLAITNLNYIKGITQVSSEYLSLSISNYVFSLFSQLNVNTWYSWENVYTYTFFRFLDLDIFDSYINHHYQKIYKPHGNSSYNNFYFENVTDRKKYVIYPYIQSLIYTFASLGLVEIAYQDIDKNSISEYDGLVAFKINKLGAYVLGIENNYQIPTIEKTNKIILDEDNLILRAEGNLALLSNLLGNYFVKVSENRFAFKPELFLKDCKNQKQIQNKISLFTQSLNIELPDYWKQAFDSMLIKSKAIKSSDVFRIFSINAKDKELMQIITNDKVIKQLVTKAEGFKIMVLNNELNTFKKRMLDYGYMIE